MLGIRLDLVKMGSLEILVNLKENSGKDKEWKNTREKIIKRDNNTCKICNIKAKNFRVHIHHIDYNKKNNNITNLISLCPYCHGQTNHNRMFWEQKINEIMNKLSSSTYNSTISKVPLEIVENLK